MKKILAAIAIVIGVAIAILLISPLFITVEVDEASPLDVRSNPTERVDSRVPDLTPKDSLDDMSKEEKEAFDDAVEAMSDVVVEANEPMDAPAPIVLVENAFQPRAHEVEGKVLLIDNLGQKILRFEDFETVNGPNLHIYLSSDLGDDDFIDLGKIKGTKGNFNYELDASIDTDKYHKVLVWCVPFGVLFSYADIA